LNHIVGGGAGRNLKGKQHGLTGEIGDILSNIPHKTEKRNKDMLEE
jgi:hypothetical protein